MPSTIIGNPLASGPQILTSGVFLSGVITPIGGINLCLAPSASGNVYVGYSAAMTLNSGGMYLSGGGKLDGMIIKPGDRYFVPKQKFVSGQLNVYVWCDAACSGQAIMYYDVQ